MINRNTYSMLAMFLVMFAMPAFAKDNAAPKVPDIRSMMKPSATNMPLVETNNSGSPIAIPALPVDTPFMQDFGARRLDSLKEILNINDDQMPYWEELVAVVKFNEKSRTEKPAVAEKSVDNDGGNEKTSRRIGSKGKGHTTTI